MGRRIADNFVGVLFAHTSNGSVVLRAGDEVPENAGPISDRHLAEPPKKTTSRRKTSTTNKTKETDEDAKSSVSGADLDAGSES